MKRWMTLEKGFIFLSIFVLVIWIANGAIPFLISMKMDAAGQFGDRFGAATSLFGGLTIILLLYTIHLQRIEISEGKKEFKIQNEILHVQRIESTYLNLLMAHNDFIKTLSMYSLELGDLPGTDIFPHVNEKIKVMLLTIDRSHSKNLSFEYTFNILYKEESLRSYLRSLDIPLKYILKSDLSNKEKSFYYSIAVSRLTIEEYNYLSNHVEYYKNNADVDAQERLDRIKTMLNSQNSLL